MPKASPGREPKVVVNIRPGPAVSSGQIHMWKKFWKRIINETRQANP